MSTPLPESFTIADCFPPVDYDQWRAAVEATLQGASFERKLVTHTYEGIDVQPVYSPRDQLGGEDPWGLPGFAPFVRGSQPAGAVLTGFDLQQEHAHPDLALTNQAILEDLQGGATSLRLRLDDAARNGFDADEAPATESAGRDGVTVYSAADLDAALANVDLNSVAVALDAGAAFLPAAAMLADLWRRRGIAPQCARGAFNADPLGTLAHSGRLPISLDTALAGLADLAQWTADRFPDVTSVGVDTAPYHNAGATAAQDIAFGVATAVEYLRSMTERGMDIDAAARQIVFRLALGTHHFLAIAKLRAARAVWSRVVDACGGAAASGAMRIHTHTSRRVLTHRDPYVNLLRNTVAVFAAAVGGADAITSVPFDALMGLPDSFSRRVARNTVLVLQEEAHLHRVIDPGGGSWFLDRLTKQLADKAWESFQETERQGGMSAALGGGWVAEQIDAAFAPRARDIARRKEGITGISEFPNSVERPEARSAPDSAKLRTAAKQRLERHRKECEISEASIPTAGQVQDLVTAAGQGATIGQLARASGLHGEQTESITPLDARSFAEPFEQLRDACDRWQAAHGRHPRAFLANLGPVSHHAARATYAKNFLEAGGFEVIGNDGFPDVDAAAAAFAESGATVAVICSSDKLYPELVPPAAARLKEAGARRVVVAGHPGDHEQAWRAQGVDRFIFIKCDVLETLRQMLREEGVLDGNG